MRLINKTKHSTLGLRVMLYNLASEANISTRGITVEIRRGSRNLHGVCYPYGSKIILWLLNSSKTDDIAHIWIHELAHTTPRNKRLFASGHGVKAQRQADTIAEKITGVARKDVTWRSRDWTTRTWPKYRTKKSALTDCNNRDCFPTLRWRLIRIKHEGKKWWVWQYKQK